MKKDKTNKINSTDTNIWVRRQWNDWRKGKVKISNISNLHWDCMSGGVRTLAPRNFVHGYIFCTDIIEGEVAHSCQHGSPPHNIKICICKCDNTKESYQKMVEHMSRAASLFGCS